MGLSLESIEKFNKSIEKNIFMVLFDEQEFEPKELMVLKDGYRTLRRVSYLLTYGILFADLGYIFNSIQNYEEGDFTKALMFYGAAYLLQKYGRRAETNENRLERLIQIEKMNGRSFD